MNDSEVKQAFAEGQAKLVDFQRQLATVQTQISLKERESRTLELTLKEVQALAGPSTTATGADTANVYKSIGKMFLQSTPAAMEKEMTTRGTELKSDAEALQKKREWLERQCQDVHSNLKEMLDRRSG